MNNVTQAAYEYAEAVRTLESADECGAPSDMLRKLRNQVQTLRGALLNEALAYFDNTYDGVTE